MGRKKPRLNYQLLTSPKNKGGIGLPDFKKYHNATHITRLIDWHCHGDNKDWVQLELSYNKQQLLYFPWTNHAKSLNNMKHPLINTTIDILHKIATTHKIASIPGPLAPIEGNPDFAPGMNQRCLPRPKHSSKFLTSHCFLGNRMRTLESFQEE